MPWTQRWISGSQISRGRLLGLQEGPAKLIPDSVGRHQQSAAQISTPSWCKVQQAFASYLAVGKYKVNQISFTAETIPRNFQRKQTSKCFWQLLAKRDLSCLEWILSLYLNFSSLPTELLSAAPNMDFIGCPVHHHDIATNSEPKNSISSKRNEAKSWCQPGSPSAIVITGYGLNSMFFVYILSSFISFSPTYLFYSTPSSPKLKKRKT